LFPSGKYCLASLAWIFVVFTSLGFFYVVVASSIYLYSFLSHCFGYLSSKIRKREVLLFDFSDWRIETEPH